MSPSTIDKMFEIYTFFENRTEIYTFFENRTEIYTFFESRFEICTCILFENRTEIFEHFVNGRWTHYKAQNRKKDTGHNLPEITNFENRINRTDTRVVKALEVIFHTRDIATGWKILLE